MLIDIEDIFSSTNTSPAILSPGAFNEAIKSCLNCEAPKCTAGCPVGINPRDMIRSIKMGRDSDYIRAAKLILNKNPLGGICGAVCLDEFCVKKCVRKNLGTPVDIPRIQATIVHRARQLGLEYKTVEPVVEEPVCVIGGGPAAISAAAALASQGVPARISAKTLGGGMNMIPEYRLPAEIRTADISAVLEHPLVEVINEEEAEAMTDKIDATNPRTDFLEEHMTPFTFFETAPKVENHVAVFGYTHVTFDVAVRSYQLGNKTVIVVPEGEELELPTQYLEVLKKLRIAIAYHMPPCAEIKIDCLSLEKNKNGSVVEAVAFGKKIAGDFMKSKGVGKLRARQTMDLYDEMPVSLECSFFGHKMVNPFILSASPFSDGLEPCMKGLRAGWGGVVLKTAFHEVDIHIPNEYMHMFDDGTYGNCDNVSHHPLTRVIEEIKILREKFPDRIIIGATGGPVTGDPEFDKAGWQRNTRMLDDSGCHAVEYSLSCPQGGDGSEGNIVSQSARKAAQIVDWILEASKPEVPKIFKLTAAVTSIATIIKALKAVFDKYPEKQPAVTLANSFPSLGFNRDPVKFNPNGWFEARTTGMHGSGVFPISCLSLASVINLGVTISGNGGLMNYRDCADFLALGVKGGLQFCSIAYHSGVNIVKDLCSGLSHMFQELNISDIDSFIGRAAPEPITDFMDLTGVKRISLVNNDECINCGNCTRCPYLAIVRNKQRMLVTNEDKCIGCGICAKLYCPADAITMIDRVEKEE
ncbi:hypothetical protein PCE1_004472 [Barthelona sp. PCE]